jgi:hypothetical protein
MFPKELVMTEFELGFVAMVVAALVVFAATLAYASAVASGSPKQAAGKPANINKQDGKLAA